MYVSPKMYHIKVVLHPNWPFGVAYILYNLFCVLSFYSVLCFQNDYHIHVVKEEEWNTNDLKNINYNKANDLFFLSV